MTPDPARSRPIDATERSGVVDPANLARYAARWVLPADDLAAVTDAYWTVDWDLAGDEVEQRILTLPAVTLSVEEGDVPARLVVTGVHRGAWQRRIAGRGRVFAIRLRPAGLAVVSDLTSAEVADSTVPLTPELDRGLHDLLDEIARAPQEDRPATADALLRERLAARPPGPGALVANAALDALTGAIHTRTGRSLPERLGCSERAVQRALRSTLGHGPKWVARWVRLQEATRLLSQEPAPALSEVAYSLGYTDQAHLTNDFRDAVGATPGAYVESLRTLTAPGGRGSAGPPRGPVRTR